MRRGREIIGLPVINMATGKEIGLVRDLAWNHDRRKIAAIEIDSGGIIGGSDPIPCNHITSIGQDAVTFDGETEALESRDCDGDRNIKAVAGLLVVTDTGHNLGTLVDLVLDDEGVVWGYELSDGLIGDIISGRNVLTPEAVLVWGSEAMVVRDKVG